MSDETCGHCAEPIEYLRATWQVDTGTVRNPAGHDTAWFHLGGGNASNTGGFHLAAPAPRCPKCRSANYRHDASDAWADYWRCADCPYTYRMSLGD
jgi:hypothetical protein